MVICQVGDATTNIGPWDESLNLAKLHQLPIIYFIVNNGYGMGTPVKEGSSEPICRRGSSFRIHGEQVDGSDVIAVRDVARRLRTRAEREGEPAIMDVVSSLPRPFSDGSGSLPQCEDERGRVEHDPTPVRAAPGREQARRRSVPGDTADKVEHEVQEAIDFADTSPAGDGGHSSITCMPPRCRHTIIQANPRFPRRKDRHDSDYLSAGAPRHTA